MSRDSIQKIDKRLEEIAISISKLEGEMQGLRYARGIVVQSEGQKGLFIDENNSMERDHQQPPDEPSISALSLQVVQENPQGVPFGEITQLAQAKTDRKVNSKTVSSSLTVHKQKGRIKQEGDLYKPILALSEVGGKEFAA